MKRQLFLLSLSLCLSFALTPLAQQTGWVVRLTFPKSDYLPGEPIVGHLVMTNVGPECLPFYGFRGALYLDDQSMPCKPKQVVLPSTLPIAPPPGTTFGPPRPPLLEPVGSIHEQDISVTFWCALDAEHSILPGPHKLSYRVQPYRQLPAMEARAEFTAVRPIGADADAYKYFKGEPLKHDEEVIKKYPTSTYAALALWEQGLTWYNSQGTMPTISVEKDFDFYNLEKKISSPLSFEEYLRQVRTISTPWEKLYSDFPEFAYKPQLLFGLARCYFHLGAQQKAVPLLQELLSKFPDSEPGKKAVAYKDVLKAHGLWPE